MTLPTFSSNTDDSRLGCELDMIRRSWRTPSSFVSYGAVFDDILAAYPWKPDIKSAQGLWRPASPHAAHWAVERLCDKQLIDPNGVFLDAGFGDGRILAITTGCFAIPSAGIESDSTIYHEGLRTIERLQSQGTLNGVPLYTALGDFTRKNTYDRLGVPLSRISTVFNYDNSDKALARLVVSDFKHDVRFVFYQDDRRKVNFPGLRRVYRFRVDPPLDSDAALVNYKYGHRIPHFGHSVYEKRLPINCSVFIKKRRSD